VQHVQQLGHGSVQRLLHLCSSTAAAADSAAGSGSCVWVVYALAAPALAGEEEAAGTSHQMMAAAPEDVHISGVRLAGGSAAAAGGVLGSVGSVDALRCLAAAPCLAELHSWSSWQQVRCSAQFVTLQCITTRYNTFHYITSHNITFWRSSQQHTAHLLVLSPLSQPCCAVLCFVLRLLLQVYQRSLGPLAQFLAAHGAAAGLLVLAIPPAAAAAAPSGAVGGQTQQQQQQVLLKLDASANREQLMDCCSKVSVCACKCNGIDYFRLFSPTLLSVCKSGRVLVSSSSCTYLQGCAAHHEWPPMSACTQPAKPDICRSRLPVSAMLAGPQFRSEDSICCIVYGMSVPATRYNHCVCCCCCCRRHRRAMPRVS
jgi:hypothetical protein